MRKTVKIDNILTTPLRTRFMYKIKNPKITFFAVDHVHTVQEIEDILDRSGERQTPQLHDVSAVPGTQHFYSTLLK